MYTRIFSILLIVSMLLVGCGSASTQQPTLQAVTQATSGGTVPTPTHETPPEVLATEVPAALTYPVVDSGQGKCYDNTAEIDCPAEGAFQGQDAQYTGMEPGYTKNGDGTVTDKNTGLTWQQSPDSDGNGKINAADKLTYMAAGEYCGNLSLGGKDDWRLPDIKTLYSLIDFRGTDPGGVSGQVSVIPFLDTGFFDFAYGDSAAGESTIDAPFASGSVYADTHTGNGIMDFAVNFAEGSIKGYGLTTSGGAEQKFYVLCVRGDSAYGANHFGDNGDGSVTDQATGLVWQKADSTKGMNWQEALAYCEGLSLAGKDDWRLPDAKSLQSLVDYSRSPATTQSAAIDALFSATAIKNEAGQDDYPYYWTSTTHLDYNGKGGNAVYIAFGRAMGLLNNTWVDLHGAGAQRSDLKNSTQTNAARGLNFARCVRGGNVTYTPAGNPSNTRPASRIDAVANLPATATPGGGDGEDGGGGSGGGVTPPSPEAIAACSSSTVGDACHFSTLFGEVNGTCRQVQIPDVIQVLACVINIP
jgi:hypothetical protein